MTLSYNLAFQEIRGHEESMYENFIHEHKNFIFDHNDHSMKVMINDHKQSCHTYSMIHFILYEIFQIVGPGKMRPEESFCVNILSEIFHRT